MALAKLCSGHSGSACSCRGWRNPWDIAGAFRDHLQVVLLRWRGHRCINGAMGLGMAVLHHRAAAPHGWWSWCPLHMDPSSLHGPHPLHMDTLIPAWTPSSSHGLPPPCTDHLLHARTTSSPHGPPPPCTDQQPPQWEYVLPRPAFMFQPASFHKCFEFDKTPFS